MAWIVELLDDRVREELEVLPDDMKARFRRIVELIQGYGLERVHEPHIWEMPAPFSAIYPFTTRPPERVQLEISRNTGSPTAIFPGSTTVP